MAKLVTNPIHFVNFSGSLLLAWWGGMIMQINHYVGIFMLVIPIIFLWYAYSREYTSL